ncbi:MAG TPA: dienelactone hydrolase family protein [Anaerolineales bacterium]|nr:dienelactone hydrolase family protein [Anaerolineales bacterium]
MKLVKRILVGIGILVLGLVIFLAGSIAVDSVLGRGRINPLINIHIANPNGPDIPAFIAYPTTPGPHPAVIMIHEFWGLKPEIVGKAEALAEEGYIVIAPNLFRDNTTNWIPRAIYQVVSTPQEQIMGDLDAVYAHLINLEDVDPERIGIMGFCFGGGNSLRYSLHNNQIAATVILYGSLVTDREQLKALPGPVLGIFGGADQSIPLEEVKAFESALNDVGISNQISIYEGQPHAFVQSIEEIRQGGAQGQAWDEVLTFLNENLQAETQSHRDTVPSSLISGLDWRYLFMLAYEHSVGHNHNH